MIELTDNADLIGPWVFEKIGKPWHPFARTAIGLVEGERVLGGVVFEDFTGASVSVHIALESKRTPAKRLLIATSEYAFRQLKVKKVIGLVPVSNTEALLMDVRLGFTPEAVIKDVYPDGDLMILSMQEQDCKFLRRPPKLELVSNG